MGPALHFIVLAPLSVKPNPAKKKAGPSLALPAQVNNNVRLSFAFFFPAEVLA
jgi:hypothetical protein